MDCKNCGTPAVENAVYCHNCGGRVDGKKPCPSCGNLNEQGHKYCIYCGARVDGKTICKGCGAEHDGGFCPNCGTQSGRGKPAKRLAKNSTTTVDSSNTYTWIMHTVGISLGLFVATMAFIFMFFINAEGESTIFYYFKDSFAETKEIKAEYIAMNGDFKGAVYAALDFSAIAACVIAALTLACVTTFFAFTVVYSVRALCGKKTRSPLNVALWTAFSYMLGASLLYPFSCGSMVGLRIDFNAATLVGLSICFIGLLLTASTVIVKDLKKLREKSFIVRLIRNAVCIVFGLIAFFMVRNAGMTVNVIVGGETMGVGGSPSIISMFILELFGIIYSGQDMLHFEMGMLGVCGVIGAVLGLAAIVFALLTVFKNVRNLLGETRKVGIVYPILAAAMSIVALVCCILMYKEATLIVRTTTSSYINTTISINYVLSILAVVFSVINLGVAIANKIVAKKMEKIDE